MRFVEISDDPIRESFSLKYLGVRNGQLGVSTSRLPMEKKMIKSQSLSQIEKAFRSER